MTPGAIRALAVFVRIVDVLATVVGLAALTSAVGIERGGWRLGFSAEAAAAVAIFCAGLHWIAGMDSHPHRRAPDARRQANNPPNATSDMRR